MAYTSVYSTPLNKTEVVSGILYEVSSPPGVTVSTTTGAGSGEDVTANGDVWFVVCVCGWVSCVVDPVVSAGEGEGSEVVDSVEVG